ncbi:GNAT family N-acetyltransferase [Actinoplanes sp. G11-F43]|uniref:GNAT family N-acetyltransferase n=1 Tax=Actinoplanes sp. G11-F43 TaxID=3424130 RepID=UPI003D3428B1
MDDLPEAGTPPGFTIRAVAGDEIAARVEVHRRAWDPKRIKRMLGLAVTGDESGSGYDLTRHRAVMASPVYRPELDLVAVGADGELVAYAIGWFDPVSRSVLFEPVGTVPEHGGLGLGRALGAEVLRVAAGLGAVQAVVNARGDDAYPVPHRLYTGLGMRPLTRIVTVTNAPEQGTGTATAGHRRRR